MTKKVPLQIIEDKTQADFIITGNSESQKGEHSEKGDHVELSLQRER
jgi:hypothetical protein